MKNEVKLGETLIGAGHSTVLLPELGTYFNTDIAQAYEAIDQCSKAGLNVIKGEVFHTPDIVADKNFSLTYKTQNRTISESYKDIIARKVLPFSTWREIYNYCKTLGLDFVVSAYDMETVDFLVDVGAACIKLSGSNLNNIPLLMHAGSTNLPVMLDARRCTFSEICIAMETLDKAGCDEAILNHSPDGSPSSADEQNLTIVESLGKLFGSPVGLSCHFPGPDMIYAATSLGYSIVEKPFCFDPSMDDVDTPWALSFNELKDVLSRMQIFWQARGTPTGRFLARPNVDPARMGIYAKDDLDEDSLITLENFQFKWPCEGLSVAHWELILGRKTAKMLTKGSALSIEDIR